MVRITTFPNISLKQLLIFQKAGNNEKGTAKQKERAVHQNMIIERNKLTMKLNYTELQFYHIFI